MNFYVYILYSESLGRYYTGFSKHHWKRQRQHRPLDRAQVYLAERSLERVTGIEPV
ncbi:MAG: hypothetical protein JXN60_09500 [Lentisphaerae bacterium]|nr:hypothetical protein [Lentisphaerota bacterium]